MREDKINRVTT